MVPRSSLAYFKGPKWNIEIEPLLLNSTHNSIFVLSKFNVDMRSGFGTLTVCKDGPSCGHVVHLLSLFHDRCCLEILVPFKRGTLNTGLIIQNS